MISRSNKTIYSILRHIRQWMWSTTLTRTCWDGIPNSFSFTYLHRHTKEMEHHRTRSLWCILCSHKIELLPPRSRSYCMQWPQTTGKISQWKEYQQSKQMGIRTSNIKHYFWMDIREHWNKAADCLSRLVKLPQDRPGQPQFRCYLQSTLMDLHSTSRTRTAQHSITEDPHSRTSWQIQLCQILLKSWTHQHATPNHSPDRYSTSTIYWYTWQILSVNALPSIYQMEKCPNVKLISSCMWKDY